MDMTDYCWTIPSPIADRNRRQSILIQWFAKWLSRLSFNSRLWTLTPLWRAKQISSRRCHGSYINEKGLYSLFTRRVPVETNPHNPQLEILTVSAWQLLNDICLARQSGVKVQRWVVSRMTIATTILQTAVEVNHHPSNNRYSILHKGSIEYLCSNLRTTSCPVYLLPVSGTHRLTPPTMHEVVWPARPSHVIIAQLNILAKSDYKGIV